MQNNAFLNSVGKEIVLFPLHRIGNKITNFQLLVLSGKIYMCQVIHPDKLLILVFPYLIYVKFWCKAAQACIFAFRRVKSGEWRVKSGEWRVESEEWRVESGEWRVESGEFRVDRGK